MSKLQLEMQKLIDENKSIIHEMKILLKDHRDANPAGNTRASIEQRVKALDELWQKFRSNHKTITENVLPDTPYIS